jgi:hypothetical protein
MNDNTATVLMVLLAFTWNIFLWTAFMYMVVHLNASLWILIIPSLFTVFPKSKSNERQQDETTK